MLSRTVFLHLSICFLNIWFSVCWYSSNCCILHFFSLNLEEDPERFLLQRKWVGAICELLLDFSGVHLPAVYPSTTYLPVNIFHWSEILKLQNTKYRTTYSFSWPFHAFSRGQENIQDHPIRTILLGLWWISIPFYLQVILPFPPRLFNILLCLLLGCWLSIIVHLSHSVVWGIFCPGLSVSQYQFLALLLSLFTNWKFCSWQQHLLKYRNYITRKRSGKNHQNPSPQY